MSTVASAHIPSAQPVVLDSDEQRRRLRARLISEGNQPGWEHAWREGLTPWDSMHENVPQPSLQWACTGIIDGGLTTRPSPDSVHASGGAPCSLVPMTGKAIVPGCGRGHDALYLARRGLHCVGVEISPSAVEAAKSWIAAQPSDDEQRDVAQAKKRIEIIRADYFDVESATGTGHDPHLSNADLVYDFTFFCAIPPELHAKWARAHAAALKPGGKLIALNFPLRPPGETSTAGPPYFVTPDTYVKLLSNDFELEFQGLPPDRPAEKELIQIWRRK